MLDSFYGDFDMFLDKENLLKNMELMLEADPLFMGEALELISHHAAQFKEKCKTNQDRKAAFAFEMLMPLTMDKRHKTAAPYIHMMDAIIYLFPDGPPKKGTWPVGDMFIDAFVASYKKKGRDRAWEVTAKGENGARVIDKIMKGRGKRK